MNSSYWTSEAFKEKMVVLTNKRLEKWALEGNPRIGQRRPLQSVAMRRKWADPGFRKKTVASIREAHKGPGC